MTEDLQAKLEARAVITASSARTILDLCKALRTDKVDRETFLNNVEFIAKDLLRMTGRENIAK